MSGLPKTEQKNDWAVISGGIATVFRRGCTNPDIYLRTGLGYGFNPDILEGD